MSLDLVLDNFLGDNNLLSLVSLSHATFVTLIVVLSLFVTLAVALSLK